MVWGGCMSSREVVAVVGRSIHPPTYLHIHIHNSPNHRYDYETVDSDAANAMMEHLRNPDFPPGIAINGYTLTGVDDFSYVDPVDGSNVRRICMVVRGGLVYVLPNIQQFSTANSLQPQPTANHTTRRASRASACSSGTGPARYSASPARAPRAPPSACTSRSTSRT